MDDITRLITEEIDSAIEAAGGVTGQWIPVANGVLSFNLNRRFLISDGVVDIVNPTKRVKIDLSCPTSLDQLHSIINSWYHGSKT